MQRHLPEPRLYGFKKPCILDAGELLLDRDQFDGLPWKTQIEALIAEAVTAKWFSGDAAAALDQFLINGVFRLRASVKVRTLGRTNGRAVRTGGPELPPSLEQLRQGLDRA